VSSETNDEYVSETETAAGSDAPADATFADVDLDATADAGTDLAPTTKALAAGSLALTLLLAYDVLTASPYLWSGWDPTAMDWLTLYSAVAVLAVAGMRIRRDPERVRELAGRYPRHPLSLAAGGGLVVFVLVGTFGPLLVPEPALNVMHNRQPPAFTSVPVNAINTCVGTVQGGACQGTMQHPLGTTQGGEDLLQWSIHGARTSLQFVLVTLAIMTPIAVVVGTTAGYLGGRVESVLMRYVEIQQSIPTVVVYFLLTYAFGISLFLLVVAYGLFNWSDMATMVHDATRTEREESYVLAARAAGADGATVIRRHLVPNVSDAVITSTTILVPKLIIIEVLVSFFGLGGEQTPSWGQLLQRGLNFSQRPPYAVDAQIEPLWWLTAVPALVVCLTVVSVSFVGDGVQTVVDPRRDD
jgi:peptide/nickel transport system permease protein